MLPMDDTEGALRELAYALDVLKADGIDLLTSYGDKWLSHASFAPVMDELNRRRAILCTHTIVDLVFSGTVWAAHPMALASLTRLVGPSQILFGSDDPYRTGADNVAGLIDYGFAAADLQAITRGNAQRLLPRLQTT